MALEDVGREQLLDHIAKMAPGTPLREGFERILRGRTGALIVLAYTPVIEQICTGGFPLDVACTPTALRELAKMDGAIVVDLAADRIVRAGVQLMPDPSISTVETGTRHRTAERVARQAAVPVVSISASMATISLYLGDRRHQIEQSAQILSRSDQALQTLERYRSRLSEGLVRLTALEVQDQVSVKDVASLAQRLEMVRRLDQDLAADIAELGTDGRFVALQRYELSAGLDELRRWLERDYAPTTTLGGDSLDVFGLAGLERLSLPELLEPATVARALGFAADTALDTRIAARGYRLLAQIKQVPPELAQRLVDHFGTLQSLFGASTAELREVDGVGPTRARAIREGLVRLAESTYADRLD